MAVWGVNEKVSIFIFHEKNGIFDNNIKKKWQVVMKKSEIRNFAQKPFFHVIFLRLAKVS